MKQPETTRSRSDRRQAAAREAQAILIDLARSQPLVDGPDGTPQCRHCDRGPTVGHAHGCPWVRALRYCTHRKLIP